MAVGLIMAEEKDGLDYGGIMKVARMFRFYMCLQLECTKFADDLVFKCE